MQVAQSIPGRVADQAGDGHCDVCIGVHCHPTYNLLVRALPHPLVAMRAEWPLPLLLLPLLLPTSRHASIIHCLVFQADFQSAISTARYH